MERIELMRNAHKALEAAKAAAGIVVIADEWANALAECGSTDRAKDEFINALNDAAEKAGESCEQSARLATSAAIRCEQKVLMNSDSNLSELQDAERGLSNAQMYAQRIKIALEMAKGVSTPEPEVE